MKTLQYCIQSSSVMGMTPFVTLATFCIIRSLSDEMYYYRQLYIPTLLGSLIGISCDFPARRETLTVYGLQLCSEMLFRSMVQEGKIKPVKNGSVYLFAFSSMLAMYMYTKYPNKNHGIIGTIFNYVTGSRVDKPKAKVTFADKSVSITDFKMHEIKTSKRDSNNNLNKNIPIQICDHEESDCIKHVLFGTLSTFSGISAIQVLIASISNPKEMSFGRVRNLVMSERVLKISLFGSSYIAIYRATSCLINRFLLSNKSDTKEIDSNQRIRDRIKIISSGLASLSMLFNPSPTIMLWIFWKSIHSYLSIELLKGDRSKIDRVNFTSIVFLAAYYMYTGLFNVTNMRPSNVKLMGTMSGGRFYQINRKALASFGMKEYEQEMVPKPDPAHCSQAFIEHFLKELTN